MKTDDFVAMLAAGADAVDADGPRRRFRMAVGVATLVGIALMVFWLGVRPTFGQDADLPMFMFKELFGVVLAGAGLATVSRLARPGGSIPVWAPALIAASLLGMWAMATFELVTAAPADRPGLWFGVSWTECTYNIVVLSVPVFAALIWGMQGLAPTRLRLAGAAAGFASGAVGALVYSLHCPELAAPFIGTWYVLGMLIPAAVGALLGPRLLRW